MKEKLIEFLKPDKRKIILAFLLPLFWVIFGLIFSKLHSMLYPPEGIMVIPGINLGIIPFILFLATYILEALFFYPFACSIIILLDAYRQRRLKEIRKDKNLLSLSIFGIVVFNPIGLAILLGIFLVTSSSILKLLNIAPEISGVYIVEVIPDSPMAKPPSLNSGMVIAKINDIEIKNVNHALEILNNTRPEDEMRIRTSGGSYLYIHIGSHENFTRGYLGIKIRDGQGNEAIL